MRIINSQTKPDPIREAGCPALSLFPERDVSEDAYQL